MESDSEVDRSYPCEAEAKIRATIPRFLLQIIASHWIVETRKTGDLVELCRINTEWNKKPLKSIAISRHIFTYPISVTKRPDRRSNAPMYKHTSPIPAAFSGELVPTQAAQT